ncbi:MAG: aminomethyl-transferring glycine dehydrogenase subunit GcvPA [Acholeplasmatales bacterium]|jgi:glycine dehydrogenase subunit 1|nr:aminomethyl-transferring glycine dehydrogenase subunit GcvPA [Acholeplasmatales bacterium]
MHKYLPQTDEDIKKMLSLLHLDSLDELYSHIEPSLIQRSLNFHEPLEEYDLLNYVKNKVKNDKSLITFVGKGCYDHYVPVVVDSLSERQEFLTAYTPYQPEVSQGTLSYIFEFQTFASKLTELEFANASMYDIDTALAESMFMALTEDKNTVLISKYVSERTISTLKTYAHFRNINVEIINEDDILDLESRINDSVFAFIGSYPNYLGHLTDFTEISKILHAKNVSLILGVNAMVLGLLKTPNEMGADICALNLQPFGCSMSFGGPHLSCICTTSKFLRKLPGRIVGKTVDRDNNPCYVLTLQAREQHIRREKATSNICSNQSLMALKATIYLATVGNNLKNIALANTIQASRLYDSLLKTGLFFDQYKKPFFNEFTLKYIGSKNIDYKKYLTKNGFLMPSSINKQFTFCATEKRTNEEIKDFVELVIKYAL